LTLPGFNVIALLRHCAGLWRDIGGCPASCFRLNNCTEISLVGVNQVWRLKVTGAKQIEGKTRGGGSHDNVEK